MCKESNNDPLDVIAAKFRAGVKVKNRKYRLVSFKQCFVGREAVDFMVENKLSRSRAEAVEVRFVCRLLSRRRPVKVIVEVLVHHVSCTHEERAI